MNFVIIQAAVTPSDVRVMAERGERAQFVKSARRSGTRHYFEFVRDENPTNQKRAPEDVG